MRRRFYEYPDKPEEPAKKPGIVQEYVQEYFLSLQKEAEELTPPLFIIEVCFFYLLLGIESGGTYFVYTFAISIKCAFLIKAYLIIPVVCLLLAGLFRLLSLSIIFILYIRKMWARQ